MTGVRDPLCERTDLPSSMCSHCRGLPWDLPVIGGALDDVTFEPSEADHDRRVRGGYQAEFASDCPGCGETISPGHVITRVGNRFVCMDCAENDQRLS